MNNTPNAADLPEGSVVASNYSVVMAIRPAGERERWNFHGSQLGTDRDAQELLDLPGGAVLRHGYPES